MGKVKPRFDKKNMESFANMHRHLKNQDLMFDIDRCCADLTADVRLEMLMTKENNLYTEYKFVNNKVRFTALFEVKYKKTKSAAEALDPGKANSIARLEMARLLNCRLFVVFETEGKQPFEFYEIDLKDGSPKPAGILTFANCDPETAMRSFWYEDLEMSAE
jgi:hypothetical protein